MTNVGKVNGHGLKVKFDTGWLTWPATIGIIIHRTIFIKFAIFRDSSQV